MFEKILAAHDGPEGARKKFDAAVELAARLKAPVQTAGFEERIPRYAETMGEAKRRAARDGVPLETCLVGGR